MPWVRDCQLPCLKNMQILAVVERLLQQMTYTCIRFHFRNVQSIMQTFVKLQGVKPITYRSNKRVHLNTFS